MRKIIFAILKPKVPASLLKESFKPIYFSNVVRARFSTNKEKEDVKVDSQDSHEDFKPKAKPTPDYESFFPEIEKVRFFRFFFPILIHI